jgi:hypothetical protein
MTEPAIPLVVGVRKRKTLMKCKCYCGGSYSKNTVEKHHMTIRHRLHDELKQHVDNYVSPANQS